MQITAREMGTRNKFGLFLIFIIGALPAVLTNIDGIIYSYGAPFIIAHVNLPLYYLGILISSYAAGIAIFNLIGGFLFDKFSPRITVTISILVFSLSTIATGYSNTALELFLSRMLVGFGAGMFESSSLAVLGDTNPHFRGSGAMVWAVLGSIGVIIGPYIVLPLLPNYSIAFLISGILGFIVAGIFFFVMPPVFKKEKKERNPLKFAFNKYTIYPILGMFFFGFTLLNVLGYYSEFLTKIIVFSSAQTAVLISMIGIGGIIFSLPAGYVSDKIGRKPILLIGITLILVGIIAITYAPKNYIAFILLTIMFGAGYNIYFTLTGVTGQDMVKDTSTGSVSGVIFMFFNIGGIIGPLLLASYITTTSFRSGMLYFMIIPAAIAFILTLLMKFPKPIKEVADEQLKEGL